jgi:hypothetical protein
VARGLVIDREDGRALVLTAEGEFRYVRGRRARAVAVGDTLALADRTVPRAPAAARPVGKEAAPAGKASREEAGEPAVTGGPESPGAGAPTLRPPVRQHPDTGGVPRGQTVPEKRLQELVREREIVVIPGPRKAEDAPRTEGDKEPGEKGPRHARGTDGRNAASPRGGGQGGAR